MGKPSACHGGGEKLLRAEINSVPGGEKACARQENAFPVSCFSGRLSTI